MKRIWIFILMHLNYIISYGFLGYLFIYGILRLYNYDIIYNYILLFSFGIYLGYQMFFYLYRYLDKNK